jgi:hypothetical protein
MISKVIEKYARTLSVEPTLDSVLEALRVDVPIANEPITLETYSLTKLNQILAFHRDIAAEAEKQKRKNSIKIEEQEKELVEKKRYLESLVASMQLHDSLYKKLIILDSPKTLPIKNKTPVPISSIAIGPKTTAYAGTNLTRYLDREEMFFESLADEDCTVELNLLLGAAQPFNFIKVNFLEDEIMRAPQTLNAFLNEDTIPLITDREEGSLALYTVPIYNKSVSVVISKRDVMESGGLLRKTFAISSIEVALVEYESEYRFNFEKQVRGFTAYKVEPVIRANTRQEIINVEGFTESGKSTHSLDEIVGSTSLKKISGEIRISRLDESMAGFTYKVHDRKLIETHKVRKDNNEISVFSKAPVLTEPTVYETNLLFSNREKSILLATGTGSKMHIAIPVSGFDSQLVDSLILTVDGVEWARVSDADDTVTGSEVWEWRNNKIYFGAAGQPVQGTAIRITLPEENLAIVRINNQYYGKPRFPFDPDPNSFNLYEMSDVARTNRKVLPLNSTVVKLDPLIIEGSIKIRALDENEDPISVLITEQVFVNGRRELTAEGDYSIDYNSGIIYLYTPIKGAQKVTVSYSYYEKTNCRDHLSYDSETGLLKMLKLKAKPVTDYVGKNPYQVNFGGKTYLTEATSTTQSSAYVLSNSGILEGTIDTSNLFISDDPIIEVPFYNGFWELKGIKQVTATAPTFRGADSVKSFAIENNSKVYKDGMFSFGEPDYFVNLVTSSGDVSAKGDYYYDAANGIIYFYLESTREVIGPFTYSYVIKTDSMRNTNVFSVDYENGKLYTLKSLIDTGPNAFITYKAANYLLQYAIAKPLEVISYEGKKITFNSNDLVKENATVKTIVEEIGEETFIDEYKYYTPFISNILLMLR